MGRTKGALNKKKVGVSPKKELKKRRSEKPIDQLITDTFISASEDYDESAESEKSEKSI